jgi:hypothetical protein
MAFQYDLTILKTRDGLLDFLGLEETIFERVLSFDPLAYQPVESMRDGIICFDIPPFLRHEIPKRNGRGFRTVWEITICPNEYKALARRLNNFLSHKLNGFPHPRSFGYISGRNIRENAREHCGHKHLLSIDINSFFPSIGLPRVANFLVSMGITQEIGDLLGRFMTIGGSVPLGLPTSPILANAICLPLDLELDALSQKYQVTYSRYADDISFSAKEESLPSSSVIGEIIARHGFGIAASKTRSSKVGQAHYVTGLSINDPDQPHVPRRKKRRLRQEIYFAKKYGLDDHLHRLGFNDHRLIQREINRIDGLVKFIAFHEPKLSLLLKSNWGEILQKSGHRPSFRPKNYARTPFFICVDEAEYLRADGRIVLALGMAVSQHQETINLAVKDVLDKALSDPWATGNRQVLERQGVHFAEAHPDLRLTFVDRMRSLPFEGYVAMGAIDEGGGYEAGYLRLLRALIKRRLMAAESKAAVLIFERNSKVDENLIRDVVMRSYDELRRSNNRHPEQCFVKFTNKPNWGISVPDFLLGVLGRYLKSGDDRPKDGRERDRKLFERVRDKYRVIVDVDSWVEYSRRREIGPWPEGNKDGAA